MRLPQSPSSSAKVPCYQNEVGMPSSALGVFFYEHIAAIIVPVSAAERPSSIRQKSSHQLGANVSNLNDKVYDKKLGMPIIYWLFVTSQRTTDGPFLYYSIICSQSK